MLICGIDEAGRGPLAGPVTAAAVILPPDFPLEILNDSKKLSEKKRNLAASVIREKALGWGIGWVWEKQIDRLNILQASLLAMRYAHESMLLQLMSKECSTIDHTVIVDGTFCPDISSNSRALPKADASVPAVMAASILAKTARDGVMLRLAKLFPAYGYDKHKGYPTAAHRAACREFGPSPIQRMSFRY